MFNWVCPRCGHEVPPSKTECPFCAPRQPDAPQPDAPQPEVPTNIQQPPVPQYQPPQPPPQYAQQAPPPQYWQPPPPPQGGAPQQYPPQYAQQAPPQYWQPPQQPYPPQQYPPQPQYQPPPSPPHEPTPPQYAPVPQYSQPPAPAPEFRQPERAPTPWPPPEERAAKPAWLVAALAFGGVLLVFGIAYFLMGSHGSSASKDASAKQQTTNPLQKYVEVVGIRLFSGKGGQQVKFLVVNHSGAEFTDLQANVTLYASTQRSEEDSVGSFKFKVDSVGPNESKELTAPLKTEKGPADLPEDWRNISADVQVQTPQ